MLLLIELVVFLFVFALYFLRIKKYVGGGVAFSPFILSTILLWLFFYPNFLLARSYGITYSIYPFFIASAAMVLFLLGHILAGGDGRVRTGFQPSTEKISPNFDIVDLSYVLLMFSLISAGLWFFKGIPDVLSSILYSLNFGSNADFAAAIREARFEQTKGAYFGETYRGQGVFSGIMRVGFPIVVGYFIYRYISVKRKLYLALLVLSFSIGFLFILSIGSRAPVIFYFIMCMGCYSMFKPIKVRSLILFSCVVITFLIVLSAFSTKMSFLLDDLSLSSIRLALDQIISRIFLGNASNDVVVIDLIESGRWQLAWGRENFVKVISSIPGFHYDSPLSYRLFAYLNPLSERSTFFSGTYMAIVYVDFAFLGVLFIYPMLGYLITKSKKYYENTRLVNGPAKMSAGGVFYYLCASSVTTGPSGTLSGLLIFFLIIIILGSVRSILRISH